jgi:hypothetical protein
MKARQAFLFTRNFLAYLSHWEVSYKEIGYALEGMKQTP